MAAKNFGGRVRTVFMILIAFMRRSISRIISTRCEAPTARRPSPYFIASLYTWVMHVQIDINGVAHLLPPSAWRSPRPPGVFAFVRHDFQTDYYFRKDWGYS